MNHKRFILMLAVALTVISLAALLSLPGWAEGPDPSGFPKPEGSASITAATVSSRISYQGVLKEGGTPVTGARNFTFRFYTAAGCATPAGSPIVLNGVAVANGLFSVKLDVDQALFDGQGLWLGVDVGGAGNVACEEIVPVPYALSLRPGAVIVGSVDNGSVISVTNTYSPTLSDSLFPQGIGRRQAIEANSPHGTAIIGRSTDDDSIVGQSSEGYGIRGESERDSGVYGTSHEGNGGDFETFSAAAYGIHVENTAGGAAARFVGDVKVQGEVYAQSLHTTDADGNVTGGITTKGEATYTSVQVTKGGSGIQTAAEPVVSMEATGFAIYPTYPGAAGFQVSSHDYSLDTQGDVTAQGRGSFAGNLYGGNNLSVARNATVSGNATVDGTTHLRGTLLADQDVFVGGRLTVTGIKSAAVTTASYGARTLYADESAEVYFFDRGGGQLVNGVATISLDPIWLETVTIDAGHPMRVQVTLTSDCNGVYVAAKSATGFTVRELRGGASNATFDWEVAAKRKSYEDVRLAPVTPESRKE